MGLARAGRTDQAGCCSSPFAHCASRGRRRWDRERPQSQASTSRLKWLLTPRARRLLAMACPITYWSRWATRVLGDGIEARRASFEGRSGGGAGSGTGWGVISARALVAQRAQMRVVESKPPSKSGMSWLKQKEQQDRLVGHADTRARGMSGPPTMGGRIPHSDGVRHLPNQCPVASLGDRLAFGDGTTACRATGGIRP